MVITLLCTASTVLSTRQPDASDAIYARVERPLVRIAAMNYDESSDILGGRIRVTPQTSSGWFSGGQQASS